MLELEGVHGAYGEIKAVRGLDLQMGPGETVALVGRNGAGKTTTLRLIAGVLEPTQGDVRWLGGSIVDLPPEARVEKGIVLVPEGRGMFPGLTVEENLRMGAYWRKPKPRELKEGLDEVYGLMPRLSERRRQAAGSLSGGEQQMLAVGRGLMSDPRVLLFDEPSLGLSPAMVGSLYELLHELKERKVAFVLVEQYVQLALELCDKAIGLNKGEVVVSGSAAEVVASGRLTDVYMGGSELESELEEELQELGVVG
ncbi:MAG TPA: ABC transporter ATP-binding protein [Acidimicrobiales bacterium]|nr:ABC transporter ATP-binding protein [Acidimicrobiales bacterium]